MKPHLPSALRRALLACCALSVGLTLSSGIAAADTTLGKTDTITIDYAASSTQTPLDAAGVLTLTGDTKLMLLNMGDITGFSYTLCTGVSGLQTADGELTLTTGNNSATAYFDTTAPGSSIWADASLQWVSDRLLLVLNNTRVKDSVTITERQTSSVDYQEYKGVSFESITGGTIIGLGDSTMSNNGSVSFSNNSNNQGGAIFADWCTITMSKNGSVSFNANSADDNGGAIDVHYEGELTLSNNGSVSFLENKATADGGAIFGSDDSSITLSGNGSISFSGNISYLDGGAMTGLFGTTIELNNNSSISISENTATRNGGAIHDYESSISLNENGSVSFSKNAAGDNGGAANIESDSLFTLSYNGSVSFVENAVEYGGKGGAVCAVNSSVTLSNNGSVSFVENAAGYNGEGGAVYAVNSSVTLSDNGSVGFSGNTASSGDGYGGAIYGENNSSITLSNNGSVSFIENEGDRFGGAISAIDSSIKMNNNDSVSFIGNEAHRYGGALRAYNSSIAVTYNGNVSFYENKVSHNAGWGSAISGEGNSSITLSDNGSVSFGGNISSGSGGAIYAEGSSIEMNNNDSVSFIGNEAQYGGAIYVKSNSRILLLNDNGSISFSKNKANSDGGAIYGNYCTITLSDNDDVSFSGNSSMARGGAIYVIYFSSNVTVSNNDKVCFEKNVSKKDGAYRLQSIYSNGGRLVLSAPENGSITFKDSIYAEGEVKLNAAYDHDGDASTAPIAQSGTITFTGEQAEADLETYLADNNITLSDEALAAAIRQSKTSTLNATTTLYDGTLEVKKGAILEVGNTLTVNDGATLAITDNGQLRNSGTLTLNGKTILGSTISNSGTVKLGGTIDISGITPYETGISVRVNVFGYEGTRSGFLREGDCRIKVVNGGTIEDTGATIDYNGEVMTGVSSLADGIVQVKTQDINYREYLLENTDNATYSRIATASGGQLERISLRGGILNLDSSLDSGVTLKILGDIPQSIDMWENVVLSKGSLEELSDSRELIISGKASSVYEITGELGLGAGVSLKDWNGTVRATDTTLSSGGVDTTEWKNTELKGVTTVQQGATLTLGGNVLLCGKISNSGTLNLTGNITVDAENYAPEDAVKEVLDYYIGASALPNTKNSGFESAAWDITIAEGGVIDGSAATWTVTGIDAAGLRFDSDGTLHAYGKEVGSVFHVAAGDSIIYGSGNEADFTNSKGTEATGISLNGGTLVLNTGLRDNREDYVKSTAASTVEIGNGVELSAAQLDASAAEVTLSGKGRYTLETGANALNTGVGLGSDWRGTVETNGSTSALELDSLGVSGSKVELGSDSHTLADRNQSVAADLNSTGSVSLTGKELTLSGNNTLGSLSVGSLAITGGSTTVPNGLTTAGESSVADGASLSIDGASSIGGKITLGTGSTLTLDGTIKVNKDSFAPEDAAVDRVGYFIGSSTTPNSTNSGFEAACWDITIAGGGTITDNGADWQLVGDADADFSFESDGTLHAYGSGVGTVFHVAAGDSIIYGSGNEADFTNSKGTEATGISLNGGTLVLNTTLRDNRDDYVKSTAASTVEIGSGVELSAAQLDASAADVTLGGAGGYTMESGANTLGSGVSVGSDWRGTVNTIGDTSALELDTLGVSGSKVELGSDCHTLADRDQSAAADLNSTGSISLTGKELTLSGNNTLGSLSVGSLAITGGSTTVSNGLTTAGESSVADGASLSIDGASALGGKITLGTGSTLTLDGTITVNKDSFAPEDAVEDVTGYFIGSSTTPNSTNSGFEAACWDITIAEGGTITDNGADWQLVGDADADFSFEADGTLHAYGSDVGSVFHVAAGDSIIYGSGNEADFTNSKGTEATGISLNGGTLVLNTALRDNRVDYVKSTAASTVEIGNGVELKAAQLDASAAEVTLAGTGGYDLESGSALAGGVKLGSGWKGTVYTGAIAAGTESLDVNHLGNADSTVQLGKSGNVSMNSLTADAVGTVETPGAFSLMSQTSRVQHLTVKGGLTLGSADSAATLIATGALSTQGITLGNIGSSASAAMLLDDTLNLTVADSELLKLTGNTTVLTLGTAYAGTTTLNGEKEVLGSNGKMIYTLVWQTPLTRAVASTSLVLQADTNPVYVQNKVGEQVKHYSYNGPAGLRILNAAYAEHNPQQNAAGGALAGLIDTVDAGKMTDEDLAAVAGSSTAVLGQALSGDVERQLRAIRNRAAMGNHGTNSVAWDGKGGLVSTSLPSRYFAWVNAEGNRAEQNADGTAPGYTLNSWGGTVGTGMQVNSSLTMGLALSAMYGDLQSDGPDSLDGDMDTTYLSAFARYESGKWSHAFIGTAGTMEADYKRTVSHASDSYHTYGDTDGTAFGLMYEVSRDFTLGSKGTLSPVFNISYRHAEVDGYRESGADAALNVGEQSLDTMTLGLGARYAAVVGERAFNRACAFEARALAKYDFGDTQNNIDVGFVNHATRANIESAEMGAFGVELGAGISVPVGKGSIFADGSVELRSDYTNCNATVGYSIQF